MEIKVGIREGIQMEIKVEIQTEINQENKVKYVKKPFFSHFDTCYMIDNFVFMIGSIDDGTDIFTT